MTKLVFLIKLFLSNITGGCYNLKLLKN